MTVETHLGPNTEVHQIYLKEVTGVIWGLEGFTPKIDLYITPIWYDRNRSNKTYIVMFEPITSTSSKCDEAQPKYTWWDGLGWGFIRVLPQGHLKVISRSYQGQISQTGWK